MPATLMSPLSVEPRRSPPPSAAPPVSAEPTVYDRIEAAIRYLAREYRAQPTLEEIAAAAGMSPFHFQRVFTRWAGVSPKRFVQFHTAEFAKQLLRDSRSVLAAAFESGLSGPGRLHDLLLTIEAMTPGEYRQGGAGVEIVWGRHDSPFGEMTIAATPRGICGVWFATSGARGGVAELAGRWPEATLVEDPSRTARYVERIFGTGARGAGVERLALVVRGTPFQVKVWEALLRIPEGAVATYGDIAAAIGHPKAVRAVGSAVGDNPIAYLIPCHRVIRSTGDFGNYGGGPARKRAMLFLETAAYPAAAQSR